MVAVLTPQPLLSALCCKQKLVRCNCTQFGVQAQAAQRWCTRSRSCRVASRRGYVQMDAAVAALRHAPEALLNPDQLQFRAPVAFL